MNQPADDEQPVPADSSSRGPLDESAAQASPTQPLDWAAARIEAARADEASVSDAIADRVGELMRAELADHKLTKKELRGFANEILAEPTPSASSEEEVKQ